MRVGAVLAVAAGVLLGAVFGQPGSSRAAGAAVPKNKTLPTITGTPEAGQTLTAKRGTWSGSPTSFSYSWSRCDTTGNGCATIGATGKLYNLTDTDVGHTLRVTVTARNASGAGKATSAPTAIVSPSGCPPGAGAIQIAQLAPPARLVVAAGSVVRPVTRSTRMLRVHFQVTACSGRAVQGAIVTATAIPYNQFAVAGVHTDPNGAVTFTERRQRGFPASPHQRLLAVLVHAYKAGDPVLAGVSTTRVFAFHISGR
jgi:hypothetical protein